MKMENKHPNGRSRPRKAGTFSNTTNFEGVFERSYRRCRIAYRSEDVLFKRIYLIFHNSVTAPSVRVRLKPSGEIVRSRKGHPAYCAQNTTRPGLPRT